MASEDDDDWTTAMVCGIAAPPHVIGFTREPVSPYVCPECGGATRDGGPPWASIQIADNSSEGVVGHGCSEACAGANLDKRIAAKKGGA